MITCRYVNDFLMDYVHGELPERERLEFEKHMAVCPPCLAYLESYKQTIRLGKAACTAPDAPVPAEIPDELVKAILAARHKKPR